MSKIKEALDRTHEIDYKRYVSFMEWVCDQNEAVSDCDTNEEEKNTIVSSTRNTSIVPANTLKAVNNIDFNPKLGA